MRLLNQDFLIGAAVVGSLPGDDGKDGDHECGEEQEIAWGQ